MSSPRRSSSSIFKNEDDACYSLEKAQAELRLERQRRLKLFRRVGLPLCLLGFLLVAYILKDAFISLFKEDHMIQQYMEAQKEHQHDEEQEQAAPKAKTFGRAGARMKIELILPVQGRGIKEFTDMILEAVDMKPSEICLVWTPSEEQEPALKINGEDRMKVQAGGRENEILLKPGMRAADLRLALNESYRRIYGEHVLRPLQLAIFAEKLKKAGAEETEFLPEFVSSKKELKDHRKQTLLLLPKADTDVVPGKTGSGDRREDGATDKAIDKRVKNR